MGMFDYVRFECDCPVCGKTLNEFQSKSGPCDLRSIKPTKLENFYAFCNKCGSMIVFNKPWDKKKWTRSVKKKGQDGGQQDYDLEEKFSKSQIKQSTTEKRMRDD